jgi:hypothetical protein
VKECEDSGGYFDVQVPVSSSYRVNVDSFEFVEGTN